MDFVADLKAMGMTEAEARAWSIFSPYGTEKTAAVLRNGTRFVHYTSADVGMSILTEQEVWMRSSTTMNDFSELEHGSRLLVELWQSDVGARFRELIDGLFPGTTQKTAVQFDEWFPRFKVETFLTCVSEHRSEEDGLGRLSMWRAYGGNSGVALVLNQKPFASTSEALNAYSAPVMYFEKQQMVAEWERINERLSENLDFVRSLGEETVSAYVFQLFRTAVVATKHPGFAEEMEWRVIHSPTFEASDRLRHAIKSVRGNPQSIYKIPLENVPDEGLVGMDIPSLVDQIIIGPTEHSYAIAEAFARRLKDLGVENAWERVKISAIPLRQTS